MPNSPSPCAVELLVTGAGPSGLASAALAKVRGLDSVVGRPMGFWRENMPEGMFLRSGPQWHIDAEGVHTLEGIPRASDDLSRGGGSTPDSAVSGLL
jgi:cation diffusion facilitator CzcD-associated flavoprotein CzcO